MIEASIFPDTATDSSEHFLALFVRGLNLLKGCLSLPLLSDRNTETKKDGNFSQETEFETEHPHVFLFGHVDNAPRRCLGQDYLILGGKGHLFDLTGI